MEKKRSFGAILLIVLFALSFTSCKQRELSKEQITTPKIVNLKAEVANLDLEQVFFTIAKYIDGKWEKTQGYFKKGELVGKGKFITNYKIIDIKEEERKKQIGPDKFIIQKVFKIRLKNIKAGEEIIRETPPSRR